MPDALTPAQRALIEALAEREAREYLARQAAQRKAERARRSDRPALHNHSQAA